MKPVSAAPPITVTKILFATDFSRPSSAALPYAASLARKHSAKVYAVHVRPEPLGLPTAIRTGLHTIGAQPQGESGEALADIERRLTGVSHEILSPKGDVWVELAEIIYVNKVDMIVLGTHGRSGASKILMGSVAERIFRQASCPVLTVGPGVSGEPASIVDLHEILFATDFSPESLTALPYAISLAQQQDARLYLAYVADTPLEPSAEALLKSRLLQLIPTEAQFSSTPKAFVEYGAPAERVLALAEELATDLIILGVKHIPLNFEPSTHLPLATAYKVVSQALCPVLTVRG